MPNFTLFTHEPDIRIFAPGEIIFSAGQSADGLMYAVLEGEVEIILQERVLNTITPGSIFGEMGLLDQKPRVASAIAKTDCSVAVITEHRFMQLVSQNPHFALELMRLLAERVRENLVS